ncbi:MAG: lysine--tRNA ligase [Candidatus Poseidoniales archaeon]
MHWADHTAQRLSQKNDSQVIASGITPSGEFHIGHLREILTAEMIHRACIDAGIKSEYIFIVDSMDPLRRVYDFLSDEYEKFIGFPLVNIPAPNPDGTPNYQGENYAIHFLNPFLEALKQIGVNPRVVMNHETYENGEFAEKIDLAIKNRGEIHETIEKISGRELPESWYPFNPIGSDGSMDGVTVTGYEKPYVFWTDRNGVNGKSDIRKAEGKMPWRVDWAAKWGVHRITCEPAGKDHGASGGSYDTGIPICRILGGEPPEKMVYEWIQLKGSGPMSSSSGNTIGPIEALNLVPPEILRYVIARTKIKKHIDFDTGPSLFETADEYERLVSNPPKNGDLNKKKKVARDTALGALRLSQVIRGQDATLSTAGVSFRHLAMLAQIKSNDADVWKSLNKSKHIEGEPNEVLRNRLLKMRNWINSRHFPEAARIIIQEKITEENKNKINQKQMLFLTELFSKFDLIEWNEGEINEIIRTTTSEIEINPRDAYIALYLVILGSEYGPRIASIMSEVGKEVIVNIFSKSL